MKSFGMESEGMAVLEKLTGRATNATPGAKLLTARALFLKLKIYGAPTAGTNGCACCAGRV
jgi:hypothetical protein